MLKRHPYLSSFLILFALVGILSMLLRHTHNQSVTFLQEGVIGVIEVEGVMLSSDAIVDQIKSMKKADSVKGVVLRLNTPGGGVAVAQEVYEALNELRETKKVYTSMGTVAASGGYYIACATDRIFANPGTITGSIGVIMESVNVEELTKKIGIRSVQVKSGPNKDILSMFRDMTEPERQILQGMVNDTYSQFVQAIVAGRPHLNEEQVRKLADGRVFTGNQAKEAGLVDDFASFEKVIQTLGKDVGIAGDVETIRFEEEKPPMFSLLGLAPIKELLGLSKERGLFPFTPRFSLSYLMQ